MNSITLKQAAASQIQIQIARNGCGESFSLRAGAGKGVSA